MSVVSDLPSSAVRMYRETTGSADEKGRYASATWLVDYADLDSFLSTAGGVAASVGGPAGVVTRVIPLEFPDPSSAKMYARSAEYSTLGVVGSGSEATYKKAKIKINFSTVPWEYDGNLPFITERYEGAAEFITRPGSAYVFPSDNARVNHDVGVLVPCLEFALTFHQMPRLDLPLYTSLQGCVNSVAFVPSVYDIAAGYVQYLGPGASVVTTVAGVRSYEIEHRFRYRFIKHNEIMRPDGAGFEAPEDSNGDPILPEADLNALFLV